MSDTTSDAERARAACPAPGHRVGWVSTPWSDGLEYCACASILAAFEEVRASTAARITELEEAHADALEMVKNEHAEGYKRGRAEALEQMTAHVQSDSVRGEFQGALATAYHRGLERAAEIARDKAAYRGDIADAIEAIRHELRRAEAGKP